MKYSNFFLPTIKDAPSDAEIISHKLMIRAGMIKQSSAGYLFMVTSRPTCIKKN